MRRKAPVQQEADLKNKAGTAWSHSYLNQKPWHPLSYPNQMRKWIAEQTHLQKQKRAEEVSREFAQEQEFLRQITSLSKKEQEKAEAMKALSFMYLRPPGYNAESARAAEIADEKKKLGLNDDDLDQDPEQLPEDHERPVEDVQPEKKTGRVLDIYGKPVPTEEEFPALKNAPRLETGVVARAKPFGVEIRNVRCARCGKFGHQSGDRECEMRDTIMPNEEARLRRDDPLNTIMAHSDNPKWEFTHQIGGLSPPRGGFKPDDPNQQLLAEEEEDVYDEYGGFLGGDGIAEAIASRLRKEKKKKHKDKKKRKYDDTSSDSEKESKKKRKRAKTMRDKSKGDRKSNGRDHRRNGDRDQSDDEDYRREGHRELDDDDRRRKRNRDGSDDEKYSNRKTDDRDHRRKGDKWDDRRKNDEDGRRSDDYEDGRRTYDRDGGRRSDHRDDRRKLDDSDCRREWDDRDHRRGDKDGYDSKKRHR